MIAIFTWCPRLSANASNKFSTRKAQFGDGYEQVSANGLNPRSQEWSLEFTGNALYIQGIKSFLNQHKGYQAFQWSPPLEEAGLYRSEEYAVTALGNEMYNLAVTFKTAYALSQDSAAQIAPIITSQPLPSNVMQNAGATFTVSAAGSQPFTFNWEKSTDGSSWSTVSTSPDYTITQTTLADTSQIRVTVANAYGQAVSQTVNLTVQEQASVPSITTQPATTAQSLTGGQVQLTANAAGSGSLSWQWQKQIGSSWANIPNAFLPTLTLDSVEMTDAGLYRVVVSNSMGQATSNTSTVTINEYILDLTQDTLPAGMNYTGPAKFYRSVSDMLSRADANNWPVEYSGNARVGRSLPQPGITNLLQSPFDVSSPEWSLTRLNVADSQAAPDGSLDAVKLIPSTDNDTHFISQSFNKDNSADYTYSVFVKAAGLQFVMIQLGNVSYQANPMKVYADLTSGLATASDMSRVVLKPYGNGWYRVSVTVTTNTTGAALLAQVYGSSGMDAGDETYAANGTDGILVWGAMVQKAGLPLRAIPVANASAAESASVNKDHGATRFELTYNTGVKELVSFGAGSATALPTETENWHNRFVAQIRYMA